MGRLAPNSVVNEVLEMHPGNGGGSDGMMVMPLDGTTSIVDTTKEEAMSEESRLGLKAFLNKIKSAK